MILFQINGQRQQKESQQERLPSTTAEIIPSSLLQEKKCRKPAPAAEQVMLNTGLQNWMIFLLLQLCFDDSVVAGRTGESRGISPSSWSKKAVTLKKKPSPAQPRALYWVWKEKCESVKQWNSDIKKNRMEKNLCQRSSKDEGLCVRQVGGRR